MKTAVIAVLLLCLGCSERVKYRYLPTAPDTCCHVPKCHKDDDSRKDSTHEDAGRSSPRTHS